MGIIVVEKKKKKTQDKSSMIKNITKEAKHIKNKRRILSPRFSVEEQERLRSMFERQKEESKKRTSDGFKKKKSEINKKDAAKLKVGKRKRKRSREV